MHCKDINAQIRRQLKTDYPNWQRLNRAEPGQCPRLPVCPQYRRIAFDSGYFQPIPHMTAGVSQAIDLRKNGERSFNLIKKREGLESARIRGQHNILVQSIFTTVATLLIELAGKRKSPPPQQHRQSQLLSA